MQKLTLACIEFRTSRDPFCLHHHAGRQGQMNGASMSFKATEFTAHFHSKDIDLYIAKLNTLNITDPYNAPGVLLTCINKGTDRFPDLQYPDIYNYLINFPF